MAKIALIEAKPSKNDYIRLFDNEFEFDEFEFLLFEFFVFVQCKMFYLFFRAINRIRYGAMP